MVRAIGCAVQDVGGTAADAASLTEVWRRLELDAGGRIDRMRFEAQTVTCCCPRGPTEQLIGRRCQRCQGYPA
jgi:hypothetical protein